MKTMSMASESTMANNNLELASWNRQRTSEELLSFIATHQSALSDMDELE